jgi:FkbM family methyltransferase
MSLQSHKLLNSVLPLPVKKLLRRSALQVIPTMRHLDMQFRLRNLRRLGFSPRTIIDVGAGHGDWTRMVAKIWPDARITGFEPNQTERESLEATKRDVPQFRYLAFFLGPQSRQSVQYRNRGTTTSLLAQPEDVGLPAEAPMMMLDQMTSEGALEQPDFIKLDVQGYELEVLRGGERVLKNCTAALLEVSLFPLFDGAPRAHDVIDFMRQRGMIWYDVMGILRRPSDDALWQLDLMFLREGHPLLKPQPH